MDYASHTGSQPAEWGPPIHVAGVGPSAERLAFTPLPGSAGADPSLITIESDGIVWIFDHTDDAGTHHYLPDRRVDCDGSGQIRPDRRLGP